MSEDGTFYTCPACGKKVDPAAADVVAVVKLIHTPGEDIEGEGSYWHARHAPRQGNSDYRWVDKLQRD
jgi:hypothetical protein